MRTSEADIWVEVQKMNLAGEVIWKYEGRVLEQDSSSIKLEAYFNRPDMPFMNIVLKENDRFVETFYNDRWYNIFEIYDRDDGRRKGWYCNVCKPAVFEDRVVSYVDLALDLWVSAEGTQTVLDEDEFGALTLDDETRMKALRGLKKLQSLFESKDLR